jgi:Arc/MetJ family transcription regulator
MKRLSLAVDPDLLERVKRLSGTRTKREAVEIALWEYVRRRETERLRGLEGSGIVSMGVEEILTWRRSDVEDK